MEKKKINYIVIHCSATKEGKIFKASDIDKWHKERGYKKIGYHYVIDLDGKVEKGREESEVGAHVSGFNTGSIGICYIGGLDANGKAKDTRTAAQKKALKELVDQIKQKYPGVKVQGHCDFPGVTKACPCFDAKKEYA